MPKHSVKQRRRPFRAAQRDITSDDILRGVLQRQAEIERQEARPVAASQLGRPISKSEAAQMLAQVRPIYR